MPNDKSFKRKAKRDPDQDQGADDDDQFEIKSKVKKSESDVENSEEDIKPKKKVKRESPGRTKSELEHESESESESEPAAAPPRSTNGQAGDELIDEDGRPYFLVSDKKRVTLSEFKGKQYVNIREYYTDKTDGKEKPGKKGITLDMTQWDLFKTKIGTVDRWIGSSGSGKGKGKGKKR